MLTRSMSSAQQAEVAATAPVKSSESYGQRNSFVYGALVVVCFLYFYRPDDIVVPLGEFVTGGH